MPKTIAALLARSMSVDAVLRTGTLLARELEATLEVDPTADVAAKMTLLDALSTRASETMGAAS